MAEWMKNSLITAHEIYIYKKVESPSVAVRVVDVLFRCKLLGFLTFTGQFFLTPTSSAFSPLFHDSFPDFTKARLFFSKALDMFKSTALLQSRELSSSRLAQNSFPIPDLVLNF